MFDVKCCLCEANLLFSVVPLLPKCKGANFFGIHRYKLYNTNRITRAYLKQLKYETSTRNTGREETQILNCEL